MRYQAGQRLRHPQFGEGLVVEVHTDRGREVLEVVFQGQLRRLSATRVWEVVDGSTPVAPVPPGVAPSGPQGAEAGSPPRTWHAQGDSLIERWREGVVAPEIGRASCRERVYVLV